MLISKMLFEKIGHGQDISSRSLICQQCFFLDVSLLYRIVKTILPGALSTLGSCEILCHQISVVLFKIIRIHVIPSKNNNQIFWNCLSISLIYIVIDAAHVSVLCPYRCRHVHLSIAYSNLYTLPMNKP